MADTLAQQPSRPQHHEPLRPHVNANMVVKTSRRNCELRPTNIRHSLHERPIQKTCTSIILQATVARRVSCTMGLLQRAIRTSQSRPTALHPTKEAAQYSRDLPFPRQLELTICFRVSAHAAMSPHRPASIGSVKRHVFYGSFSGHMFKKRSKRLPSIVTKTIFLSRYQAQPPSPKRCAQIPGSKVAPKFLYQWNFLAVLPSTKLIVTLRMPFGRRPSWAGKRFHDLAPGSGAKQAAAQR